MHKHPHVTEERIRQALGRIQEWLYEPDVSVKVTAAHLGGEPISYEKAVRLEYQPFAVGEAWGPLWDTTWFRVSGSVPKEWKGRAAVVRVAFLPNVAGIQQVEGFTAEGLVWNHGKPIAAINLNRAEIEVSRKAVGGEEFEFYVEAAANVSNSSGRDIGKPGGKLYTLSRAELSVFNPEMQALFFDFRVALQAMEAHAENDPRRGALRFALNRAVTLLDAGGPSASAEIRKVLAEVLGRTNGPHAHEVSAIGHAHIDTAWLWPLRETIRKCARTFSSQLAYMRDYPEYVFGCSQAQQYEWMKALYPDIYVGIREAVARGQWEPIGAMWVEPDCNVISGESLVRQILLGQEFFVEEFGRGSEEIWIPDVFGYSAAMPQIIRKSGIRYFLTQKISWNQFNQFPHHTFLWEGIDGTRVFTHFPPADTYNAHIDPDHLKRTLTNFKEHDRADRSLLVYGYGDGGGGPTIAMLEQARRLKDLDGFPRVKLEKVADFFPKAEANAKDLPVWVGELYLELHRGTLTSQARNKRGNRKCEFLLRDAEFLHALADIVSPTLNTRVPSPERAVYDVSGLDLEDEGDPIVALDRAWKLLLLNQFHDIIPGSSIHWVYEDSDRDYATIASLGTSVRDAALEEVNELIDTSAYSEPVIVFNTLGHRRQEVVDLPGATEPALVDVPPLGYTIIEKHQKAPANEVGVKVAKEGADFVLDNGIVRVRVNAKGQLTSLFDHRTGREAVPAGEVSNVLKLHIDRPNLWEAWDVDIFYRETACVLDDVRSLKIVESHPLRAAIEVERAFGKSTLRQRIVVCAGSPRVDFPMQVEWHETRRFMRAYFPMAVRSQRATYEIQFGHLERPTHSNTSWDMARFEVCAQKWADLSESGFGVALLNDCKYGHDAVGHVLGLSLLRSPIAPDPVADQGHQEFTYSLLPHAGDFRAAGVIEHAYALNVPLIREPVGVHPGMLPPAHAFVHVEGAGIVVETIKPAQDGNGTIVRFYESRGGRGSGKLLFGLPYRTAVWVDLMEKEISAARHEGDAVHFTFSPFEILTLRVA